MIVKDHGLKIICKCFIIEFYRIRKLHPERFAIRWFRKDWYGPEDFEESPQIPWKIFAQKLADRFTCNAPNCKSYSFLENKICHKHALPLIKEENMGEEYKRINNALSELVEDKIITYHDIRNLNVAFDKNPIRTAMNTFRYEKGWKRTIIYLEKSAMMTDEVKIWFNYNSCWW
jgi:hypothetical protein